MDPEGESHRETGPVPDPNDLIVGTIQPPSWLGRIPVLAWVFIVPAVLDGVVRLWRASPWSASTTSPTDLASVTFSVVSGAAIVALPAAILIGRPRLGRAGAWLLQGGVALALAELVGLVGRGVLATVFGPQSLDSGLFGFDDFWLQSLAVQVPATVLEIYGLARIGLGLRMIAIPTRPVGRIQFAAPAAALAVLLLADLLTIQVSQAAPASVAAAIQLAYSLLIVVAEAIVLVLWAWIASLAYRQDGRTWRLIMAGAGAIAIASVVIAMGWIVALQRADTAEAFTILTWFGLAASAIRTVGAVLLVLGLSRGFEPLAAPHGSETMPDDAQDAGPATRPLGA